MADAKITALPEMGTVAKGDLLAIVDDVMGVPITRKVTLLKFLEVIDGLTAITSGIISTDTLLLLDGGTPKKATIASLWAGRRRYVEFVVFDFTASCATGNGKFYFHVPSELAGLNLEECHAEVITAGTTNTMDIQLHNLTQAADMLSTVITIDTGETGSDEAATPYVINTDEDDLAENDVLRVDVDAVHTTPAKGLILTLGFGL